MAQISVIVPIYKVEDYLAWCLDSLQVQTLADIEIICVNDGSPDNSRAIAARYAEEDNRFIIVDKKNGGLSSARNEGIKVASASYVCFLDSDDRFSPDACEVLVEMFDKTDADLITFGANCYPESSGNHWLIEHLSPRDITYEGFTPDLLFKEMSRPFAWRTACKREFLLSNKLYFDEQVVFGEDQVFHFAVYPRSNRTVLMSKKLYDYRANREGSMMQRIELDQAKKMKEHIAIMTVIFKDWHEAGFLSQYAAQMINWSVEFALYGITKLSQLERLALLESLKDLWKLYFSHEEICALSLPGATRKMVLTALEHPEKFEGFQGQLLRSAYYKQQYGLRATISRFIRGK